MNILRTLVPAKFPPGDAFVKALIYGEAPGPRGADKSGVPFFGDICGKLLYQTLLEYGYLSDHLPWDQIFATWTGELLKQYSVRLRHVALSNAYPCCPTDDGLKFRAPTWKELKSSTNVTRIRLEVDRLEPGGRIIALGRSAEAILSELGYSAVYVPHPSGQSLARLGSNPKETWKRLFVNALGQSYREVR